MIGRIDALWRDCPCKLLFALLQDVVTGKTVCGQTKVCVFDSTGSVVNERRRVTHFVDCTQTPMHLAEAVVCLAVIGPGGVPWQIAVPIEPCCEIACAAMLR